MRAAESSPFIAVSINKNGRWSSDVIQPAIAFCRWYQRPECHTHPPQQIVAVQILKQLIINDLYRIYRKCQLIFSFLDILAFRFLSFFEKYVLSMPVSCCFLSCWWLGRANLENMFHFFSSCSIFLDKELSTRGLEVVSSLFLQNSSLYRIVCYLSSSSTKVLLFVPFFTCLDWFHVSSFVLTVFQVLRLQFLILLQYIFIVLMLIQEI